MGFGKRLKKTFSKKTEHEDNNTPSRDSASQRSDVEYYKPHEIPKPKYRGKVDPQHQEMLHSFSFAGAFGRRASSTMSGAFSPGGTKAQSRRGSWISRTKSNASGSERENKPLRSRSLVPDHVPHEVKEDDEDDTDVANTGSSSTLPAQSHTEHSKAEHAELTLERTITAGVLDSGQDTPFTPKDLSEAMAKASLQQHKHLRLLPQETLAMA